MTQAVQQEIRRVPLRVLLVEDSEDDALLLLRELKRGGYEPEYERVETFEAMERALAEPWDVIFSDYRLPSFDAPTALKMWYASGSESPFILVSGKVGEDVAARAIKAGAYDYVMKDNLTRLRAVVDRSMQEAREKQDLRRAGRELQRRDAILEAVRFAADQFLGEAMGWEESVRAVLRRLGEATGVSRVYVYGGHADEDAGVWITQRYEWLAAGISTRSDEPSVRMVPRRVAGFGRWVELLGRGEPIYGHIRDLPEGERPEFQEQGILSIAVVPIFVEGQWWGFIGFDDCEAEREWSAAEVGALGTAAGTLGAAIRRRQTEERLRGSEERYRAVIEQATDGIYLLDAGTRRFLETNPSFRRMFGYTAEEVGRMEIYDLVAHPRDDVDATIERTLRSGRRIVGERRYRRKDGALLDVEVGVSVISLEGRDVICTIVRDVTERKSAEQALARSEGRLRQIIETEPECVKVLGANGSLLEMNPAGLAMIEADSLDQVRGRSVYDYIAPEHRKAFVALTEKVLHGGSGTLEFELVGLRGTRRWLDTHAVPLRDAGGGASGLLAITRDVTERKRAEAAMKESERLYRTVIEQATENIFLVDVESRRIVESNRAFRESLGYSEEDLHHMTLYDVVAADRESVDLNLRRTLKEGRASVGERKYRRKDGSLLDVEAGGSVIVRDGRKTLVAVAHDITERARAQHMLEERVATLSGIAGELTLDRPTETVLGDLAGSVVNASTAVACGIVLIGEQEDAVHLFGSYGLPEDYTASLSEAYRAGVDSPSLQAYRTRSPVLVRDVRNYILADPLYAPVHRFVREAPWDIVYSLPLVSRGLALGAVFFCFLPEGEPGEDEKVFLRAVADQAAVAVENARLFSEARGKAALEERQKLARELHDSVSQALYGIALGVETARELLPDDPDRATEPLDYATTLAEAGMTEMRALIFELRPESLEKEGLVAALEKQAAAVQARHGISVEATFGEEPDAPLETKETLYRIAQEALHNTVKHARASNASVALQENTASITLEISDDGAGFEAQNDFPGHLGLRSMRERASRQGGTLEIASEAGRGVQIIARIPKR